MKIKLAFSLILFLILYSTISFSQSNNGVNAMVGKTGEVVNKFPVAPIKQNGTVYLNENWIQGDIYLKNKNVLRGFNIRYDLQNNLLEIDSNGDIKVCDLNLLNKFTFQANGIDSLSYYNTSVVNNITFDIPAGICAILVREKVTLISYKYIDVKTATYNVALDTGDRNEKILRKNKVYAILNDQVFEVKGNAKKNSNIFKSFTREVDIYAKKNNLNFKQENDLKQIFEYFNNLI